MSLFSKDAMDCPLWSLIEDGIEELKSGFYDNQDPLNILIKLEEENEYTFKRSDLRKPDQAGSTG